MFKMKDVKENIFYTHNEKRLDIILLYSYSIIKITSTHLHVKINSFCIFMPSYQLHKDYDYETSIHNETDIDLIEAPEEYIRAFNYCKENYMFL